MAKRKAQKAKGKHVKPKEALAAKKEARKGIERRARDPVIEALLAPPEGKSKRPPFPWD